MLSDFLLDPLRGRTRLWRVVWLYCLGSSVLYSLVTALFAPSSEFAQQAVLVGGLVLTVLQLVALWQCAYNCNSRFTAGFVRASVLVSALLIPVFIYLIVTMPALLSA
jgi:hypothetical protein